MREGGSERVMVGERKRERKKVADPKYDPICIRVATMGSERRLRQKPAKKYSKTIFILFFLFKFDSFSILYFSNLTATLSFYFFM